MKSLNTSMKKVSFEYMERDSYARSSQYWRYQRDVYDKLVRLFSENTIKKVISLRPDLLKIEGIKG